MQVWSDTLFLLTKKDHKLFYCPNLSSLPKNNLEPHPSFLDSKIVKLTFGLNHMLLLSDDGIVFAIGDNTHGQQGVPIDSNVKIVLSSTRIDNLN
jgi:alpha-tubulin suppressor-like RCC1 family protein